MEKWYGNISLQKSPDLARIINKRHFQRLKNLLDSTRGTIIYGGGSDEEDLWIEPTVIGKNKPRSHNNNHNIDLCLLRWKNYDH